MLLFSCLLICTVHTIHVLNCKYICFIHYGFFLSIKQHCLSRDWANCVNILRLLDVTKTLIFTSQLPDYSCMARGKGEIARSQFDVTTTNSQWYVLFGVPTSMCSLHLVFPLSSLRHLFTQRIS